MFLPVGDSNFYGCSSLLRPFFDSPFDMDQGDLSFDHPLEDFRVHVDGDDDEQLRLALLLNRVFDTPRNRQTEAGSRIGEQETNQSSSDVIDSPDDGYQSVRLPRLRCVQIPRLGLISPSLPSTAPAIEELFSFESWEFGSAVTRHVVGDPPVNWNSPSLSPTIPQPNFDVIQANGIPQFIRFSSGEVSNATHSMYRSSSDIPNMLDVGISSPSHHDLKNDRYEGRDLIQSSWSSDYSPTRSTPLNSTLNDNDRTLDQSPSDMNSLLLTQEIQPELSHDLLCCRFNQHGDKNAQSKNDKTWTTSTMVPDMCRCISSKLRRSNGKRPSAESDLEDPLFGARSRTRSNQLMESPVNEPTEISRRVSLGAGRLLCSGSSTRDLSSHCSMSRRSSHQQLMRINSCSNEPSHRHRPSIDRDDMSTSFLLSSNSHQRDPTYRFPEDDVIRSTADSSPSQNRERLLSAISTATCIVTVRHEDSGQLLTERKWIAPKKPQWPQQTDSSHSPKDTEINISSSNISTVCNVSQSGNGSERLVDQQKQRDKEEYIVLSIRRTPSVIRLQQLLHRLPRISRVSFYSNLEAYQVAGLKDLIAPFVSTRTPVLRRSSGAGVTPNNQDSSSVSLDTTVHPDLLTSMLQIGINPVTGNTIDGPYENSRRFSLTAGVDLNHFFLPI